jgi:predicted transcriptional regulator
MAQITASELATELDTDARTVRKFLRADAKAQGNTTPGKGSRYAIERREVRSLAKRFAAWDEARKAVTEDNSDDAPEAPETPDSDS